MNDTPLRGCRIAVPESRELDVFAGLLARRGAEVLRCPLVSILDTPDPAPVLTWLRAFCAGECSDLILTTGEGLRRLLSCIDQHEPALRAAFVARLGQVRKIVRGPKPQKALRELGLAAELSAEPATTAGIIAALSNSDLHGRCFGVQLYGSEPNRPLIEFLETAGAHVRTVAPYIYADASADAEVLALVERLSSGDIDAIAFTSQAQVERLFALASKQGRQDALIAGLRRSLVAAVGPVTASALAAHGIAVDAVPQDSYFLKPLTQVLVQKLAR